VKVSIIGHKHMDTGDPAIIAAKMIELVADPDVEELIVPGIDGACACALSCAVIARDEVGGIGPRIVVVFPGRFGERPPWSAVRPSPEEWSAKADQVVELGRSMGFAAWGKAVEFCFEHVVDQVVDCGQIIAFWNGDPAAGVARAVRYLQNKMVPWEHIEIKGES
jgi:hypothetical protein